MLHILYLDDYNLGDPMFLGRLARGLVVAGLELAIVHASLEAVERSIEGLGIFPLKDDEGMFQLTNSEAVRLAERVCRDQNRAIAHELNESGIAAVRMDASSRGLLAGNTDWFISLVRSGAIPVIAPLIESGMVHAVGLTEVLADVLPDSVVLFLTRKSSVPDTPGVSDLGDPTAAGFLLKQGIRIGVISPDSFSTKPFKPIFIS